MSYLVHGVGRERRLGVPGNASDKSAWWSISRGAWRRCPDSAGLVLKGDMRSDHLPVPLTRVDRCGSSTVGRWW